ncbi:uncharacterized protein Him [Eurosta solidaginis]|uniref:uncharacterized protein Him n=1 Tax=Eurosta solidaginis TaxID=178769 RepID=UPI0035308E53
MGLTYKALKYREIKMNMTKAKASDGKSVSEDVSLVRQTPTIANEACSMLIDETTTTIPKSADNQEQFTADHIMQLCLFLAEKSRAKQLQQHQEMNARRYYENFLKEANDIGEDEIMFKDNDCNTAQTHTDTINCKSKSPITKHKSTMPLQTSPRSIRRAKLKSDKSLKQAYLTDRVSTCANNNFSHNNNSIIYNHQQQHSHQYQQQQDKRDILLKIRQQIFERKRLRQVLRGGRQEQNCQYQQRQQQQQQHRLNYDIAPLQKHDEMQQLTDVWRPW